MLSIPNEIKPLLLENSIHREIIIRFPNAAEGEISEIGSSNIIADSFELKHSICDEKEFVLGGCIAGQLTIQVVGIEQALNNKRINVFIRQTYSTGELYPSDTLYPSDDLFPGPQKATIETQIFSGTIDSSLRQKNRSVKEIIAYDDMYLMSQTKCATWFLGYVQYSIIGKDKILRNLIFSTLSHFESLTETDISYEEIPLSFNDLKILKMNYDTVKSVVKDNMVVTDLLKAYCELNACFAIISPTGKLKLTKLYKQVNTASSTEKKPVDEEINAYADLSFEEYTTRPINRIRFKFNKDQNCDYGFSTDRQSWYISDNVITSCCSDVSEFVNAFYQNNSNTVLNYIFYDLYSYRPFSADVFARWWLEPGDKVKIKTGYDDTETIESFVFERTIKGINGMRVTLKAQGTEFIGKDEIESDTV